MLIFIKDRIEQIKDTMQLITEQRNLGIIDWKEYEKKREILANGRTQLELEKRLLEEKL